MTKFRIINLDTNQLVAFEDLDQIVDWCSTIFYNNNNINRHLFLKTLICGGVIIVPIYNYTTPFILRKNLGLA